MARPAAAFFGAEHAGGGVDPYGESSTVSSPEPCGAARLAEKVVCFQDREIQGSFSGEGGRGKLGCAKR